MRARNRTGILFILGVVCLLSSVRNEDEIAEKTKIKRREFVKIKTISKHSENIERTDNIHSTENFLHYPLNQSVGDQLHRGSFLRHDVLDPNERNNKYFRKQTFLENFNKHSFQDEKFPVRRNEVIENTLKNLKNILHTKKEAVLTGVPLYSKRGLKEQNFYNKAVEYLKNVDGEENEKNYQKYTKNYLIKGHTKLNEIPSTKNTISFPTQQKRDFPAHDSETDIGLDEKSLRMFAGEDENNAIDESYSSSTASEILGTMASIFEVAEKSSVAERKEVKNLKKNTIPLLNYYKDVSDDDEAFKVPNEDLYRSNFDNNFADSFNENTKRRRERRNTVVDVEEILEPPISNTSTALTYGSEEDYPTHHVEGEVFKYEIKNSHAMKTPNKTSIEKIIEPKNEIKSPADYHLSHEVLPQFTGILDVESVSDNPSENGFRRHFLFNHGAEKLHNSFKKVTSNNSKTMFSKNPNKLKNFKIIVNKNLSHSGEVLQNNHQDLGKNSNTFFKKASSNNHSFKENELKLYDQSKIEGFIGTRDEIDQFNHYTAFNLKVENNLHNKNELTALASGNSYSSASQTKYNEISEKDISGDQNQIIKGEDGNGDDEQKSDFYNNEHSQHRKIIWKQTPVNLVELNKANKNKDKEGKIEWRWTPYYWDCDDEGSGCKLKPLQTSDGKVPKLKKLESVKSSSGKSSSGKSSSDKSSSGKSSSGKSSSGKSSSGKSSSGKSSSSKSSSSKSSSGKSSSGMTNGKSKNKDNTQIFNSGNYGLSNNKKDTGKNTNLNNPTNPKPQQPNQTTVNPNGQNGPYNSSQPPYNPNQPFPNNQQPFPNQIPQPQPPKRKKTKKIPISTKHPSQTFKINSETDEESKNANLLNSSMAKYLDIQKKQTKMNKNKAFVNKKKELNQSTWGDIIDFNRSLHKSNTEKGKLREATFSINTKENIQIEKGSAVNKKSGSQKKDKNVQLGQDFRAAEELLKSEKLQDVIKNTTKKEKVAVKLEYDKDHNTWAAKEPIKIMGEQAHKNNTKKRSGSVILVFDKKQGTWTAKIPNKNKKEERINENNIKKEKVGVVIDYDKKLGTWVAKEPEISKKMNYEKIRKVGVTLQYDKVLGTWVAKEPINLEKLILDKNSTSKKQKVAVHLKFNKKQNTWIAKEPPKINKEINIHKNNTKKEKVAVSLEFDKNHSTWTARLKYTKKQPYNDSIKYEKKVNKIFEKKNNSHSSNSFVTKQFMEMISNYTKKSKNPKRNMTTMNIKSEHKNKAETNKMPIMQLQWNNKEKTWVSKEINKTNHFLQKINTTVTNSNTINIQQNINAFPLSKNNFMEKKEKKNQPKNFVKSKSQVKKVKTKPHKSTLSRSRRDNTIFYLVKRQPISNIIQNQEFEKRSQKQPKSTKPMTNYGEIGVPKSRRKRIKMIMTRKRKFAPEFDDFESNLVSSPTYGGDDFEEISGSGSENSLEKKLKNTEKQSHIKSLTDNWNDLMNNASKKSSFHLHDKSYFPKQMVLESVRQRPRNRYSSKRSSDISSHDKYADNSLVENDDDSLSGFIIEDDSSDAKDSVQSPSNDKYSKNMNLIWDDYSPKSLNNIQKEIFFQNVPITDEYKKEKKENTGYKGIFLPDDTANVHFANPTSTATKRNPISFVNVFEKTRMYRNDSCCRMSQLDEDWEFNCCGNQNDQIDLSCCEESVEFPEDSRTTKVTWGNLGEIHRNGKNEDSGKDLMELASGFKLKSSEGTVNLGKLLNTLTNNETLLSQQKKLSGKQKHSKEHHFSNEEEVAKATSKLESGVKHTLVHPTKTPTDFNNVQQAHKPYPYVFYPTPKSSYPTFVYPAKQVNQLPQVIHPSPQIVFGNSYNDKTIPWKTYSTNLVVIPLTTRKSHKGPLRIVWGQSYHINTTSKPHTTKAINSSEHTTKRKPYRTTTTVRSANSNVENYEQDITYKMEENLNKSHSQPNLYVNTEFNKKKKQYSIEIGHKVRPSYSNQSGDKSNQHIPVVTRPKMPAVNINKGTNAKQQHKTNMSDHSKQQQYSNLSYNLKQQYPLYAGYRLQPKVQPITKLQPNVRPPIINYGNTSNSTIYFYPIHHNYSNNISKPYRWPYRPASTLKTDNNKSDSQMNKEESSGDIEEAIKFESVLINNKKEEKIRSSKKVKNGKATQDTENHKTNKVKKKPKLKSTEKGKTAVVTVQENISSPNKVAKQKNKNKSKRKNQEEMKEKAKPKLKEKVVNLSTTNKHYTTPGPLNKNRTTTMIPEEFGAESKTWLPEVKETIQNDLLSTTPFTFQTKNTTTIYTTPIYTTPIYNLSLKVNKKPAIPTKTSNQQYQPANQPYTYNINQSTYSLTTQPPPTIRFTSKSYKILCLPIEWPCYGQRFAQTKVPLSSYKVVSNQPVKNNMSIVMQPISICGEGMAMPCVKVTSSLTPSVPSVNLQANNTLYSPTSSQKTVDQPQKTVPSRNPLTIADLMFPTQISPKYEATAQSTTNFQYSQNNTEAGSENASFVTPVYQPILPIVIGSPCGTVFNPCATQNVLPCIPRPNFPCPVESVNAIEVPVQVNQLSPETTTTLSPQVLSPSQEPEMIASIATPNFEMPKTTSFTSLNSNDLQNEAQNSSYKDNPLETELTEVIHGGEKQPNIIPVVPLVPCPTALNTLCANDLHPIIPNEIPVWGVETVETIIKQIPATVTPKFNQTPRYKYKPSIKQQSYEDVGVELYGKNINGPSIGHPANESEENNFENKLPGFPEISAQVFVNTTEQVSNVNNFTYHYGNSPTSKAATSTLQLSSDSLSLNTARVEVFRAKEVDENRYSSPIQEKYVKKPKVAKTTPTTTQPTTTISTSQFTTESLTNQPTTTTSTSQPTTASSSSQVTTTSTNLSTTTLTESIASSTSILTKSTTDQNESPKTIERPYTWVYDKVSQQWNYVQSSQDSSPGDVLGPSKSTTNKSLFNELTITTTPSSEALTTKDQETIFYTSTTPATPPKEENYNISYQQQSSSSQEMYLMTTSTPPQDYTTQPPSDTTSTSAVSTDEPKTTVAVLETSTNYMSSKSVSPVETSTVTATPNIESTVSSTDKKLKIQRQDSEFVYYETTIAPSTDKSTPKDNDDDNEPDYDLINPQKVNKTNSDIRPAPPGPQKSDSWLTETQNNASKSKSSTNDTAIKVILGDRLSAGYFTPASILNQTSPEDLSNYISAGMPNTSLSLISQSNPDNAAVPYLSGRQDVSYGVEYVNEENFLPAELNSSSLYRISAMQQPHALKKAVEVDNITTTSSPKPTKKPTESKPDEYTFKDKNKKEDNLLNLIPESIKQPKTTVSTSTSLSTEEIIPGPDMKPNVTELESLPSKEDSSSTFVENFANRLRSTTVQTTVQPLLFSETTAMKIPVDIDRPSIYAALENKYIETTSTPKTTVISTTIIAEIKAEPLTDKLAEEKTTPSKVVETTPITPTLITNEVKTESKTYKVFKETLTPKTTATSTTVTNDIETEPLTYKLTEEKTTPPKPIETAATITQVSSSAIASNESQVFQGLRKPSYNQFLESIYGFDSYEEYLRNYTASINSFHVTPAPEVTSTSQTYNTKVHETTSQSTYQVFPTSHSTINNPVANLSAALQNVEPDSDNEEDGGTDNEEPTVSTSTTTKAAPSEEFTYSNVDTITTTVTSYLSPTQTTVSVAAEAYTTHSTEETPSPQRTKSLETTVNSLYESTDVASFNETDNETIGMLFSDTANVPQDPQLLESLTTITPYQVHTTRPNSTLITSETSHLSSTPETSTVYSTIDTSTTTNAYDTSTYPTFSSTVLETKSYPKTTSSTATPFSFESRNQGYPVYLSTTKTPLNVNDIFQNTTTLSPYTKSFPTSYPYSSNQTKTFTINIPVMKTEEVKKEENTEDGGLFNEMNINQTLKMHKPTSTTPKKTMKANSNNDENNKEEKPLAVLTSPSPKNKTTTTAYPYFTQRESYESLSKDDKKIQVDNSLFNNMESRNFQNKEQLPESGNKDKYDGFASYADYLFDYYNKISNSQKAEPTTLQNLYIQKDYGVQNESRLLAGSAKHDQMLQSLSNDQNQLFITEKIVSSNESQVKNEALIPNTVTLPTPATHIELSSYDIALKDYYRRIQESQPSRIQNSIQLPPFKSNNTEYETYKTFPFQSDENFYEKQNDSLKKPSEIISSFKDSEMKIDTWNTTQTPASSSVKETLNSNDTIGSLFLEKPLLIEPSQDLKEANDITVTEILDLLYPTHSPDQTGKTSILKSSATNSPPRVTSSENTSSFHGYQSYEAYLEALIKANSAVAEEDETEEDSTVTSNVSYVLPKIKAAYVSTNDSVQSITDDSLKQTTLTPLKNLNAIYSNNDDSKNSLLIQKISPAEDLLTSTSTPVLYTELSPYQQSTSTTPNTLVFGFNSYDEYLANYYRKLQIGYSSQVSDQVVTNTSAFNEDYIKNNESSSYKILPFVQSLQSEQVLPSTKFEEKQKENQEAEGLKNQKSLNSAEQENSGRFNGFASYEEYRIDYYKKLQSWYVPSTSEVPTIAVPFIQGKVENNSTTNQASELKDESIATATDFTTKVKNELDKETFYHAASDKSIQKSDEIQAASETSSFLKEKKSTVAPIIVTMQKEIEPTTKRLSTTPRGLLTETATTESYTLPVNVNDTTVPTTSSSKFDSTTDSSFQIVTKSDRSTTDFSYPNANLDSNSINNKTPAGDSIQTDAPTTSASSTTNVSPNKEKESDQDTPIPIKTMEMKLVTAENEQTTQDSTTSKTTAIPVAVIEWAKTDYPMKNTVTDEQIIQDATSKTTIMPVAVIEWTQTDYPMKNTDEQTTQDTSKTTEMNVATAKNEQTTQDTTTTKTTVMPVAVIEWTKTDYSRNNAGGISNTKERTEQNMETTPIKPVTIEMEIVPVSRSSTKQTDNLPVTTGMSPTVNNHLEKTTIPTSSQSYNLIQAPSTTLSSLLDIKTKRSTHASPTPAGVDVSTSNDEENEDIKTQNEIEHERATTPLPIVSSYTKSHGISSASIKTVFGSASHEIFSEYDMISTSTESSSANLMPQKIITEKSDTTYTLRSLPHSLNGDLSRATAVDIGSTKSPVEITTTEIASVSSELNNNNTNKLELITTTASTTTTTNFPYNSQTESKLSSLTEPSLETTSTDSTLTYSTREPSTEAVLDESLSESKTTDALLSTVDMQLKSPNLQEVSTAPTSNDYGTTYQELGIQPSMVSKINDNFEPQTTLFASSTIAPSTTMISSDIVQSSESTSNEEVKTPLPTPATVIASKPLDYQGTFEPQPETTKYPYNHLFYDYVNSWSKYLEGIQNWINKYMVPVEHHNITLHPDAHPTLNPNGTNYQHEYEEYLNSIERWEAISLVKGKLTTTTENPDDGDTTTTTSQSFDSITPKYSASYEVSSTLTIPKIVSTEEQASQNIYLNYRTAPRTDVPTFAVNEVVTTTTTTTTPQPPPTTVTTTITTTTATTTATTTSSTTTTEASQSGSLFITPPNILEDNSQFKVAPLPSSGIVYQGSVYPYQLSGALYVETNSFLLPSLNPSSVSSSTQSQIEYSDQLVVTTTPSSVLTETAVPVAVELTQSPNDMLINSPMSVKDEAENTELFKTTESSTLSTVGISSSFLSNSNPNDLSTVVPYISTITPVKEEAENTELFKTTESSSLSTVGISSGLVSNSDPNNVIPEAVWSVQAPSSAVSELSPYQVETSEQLIATRMPDTSLTDTTTPLKESPDNLLINADLKTTLPYISTTLPVIEDAENVKLTTEATTPSLITTQTPTMLLENTESTTSVETTLSTTTTTRAPYTNILVSNPNVNALTNPNLLSIKNEDTPTTTAFPTFSTTSSTTLTSKTSADTYYPTEKLVTFSDKINGENIITDFSTVSTNFVTSPLLVISQSPITNANLDSDSLNLTALTDDHKAITSSLPTNNPTRAVDLVNTAEAKLSTAPAITSQYKVSSIPETVKVTTVSQLMSQSPQEIANQKKKAQEEEEEQEAQDSQPFAETSSRVSSESIPPRQATTVSVTKSRSLLSTLLTTKRVSLTSSRYIGDEIQGPNAGDLIINAELKSSDPYKNIQEHSLFPTQTTGSDKIVTPVVMGSKITLAKLLSTISPRVASAATITQPKSKSPVFQSLAFQLATNDVVLSKDLEKYPHLEPDSVESYEETPIGNEAIDKLTEGYETGPDQFSVKRGDLPEIEGSSDENQSKFITKPDTFTQSESKDINESPVLNEDFPIKENFHSDKIDNRVVSERSNNVEPFVSKIESEAAPLVPFNDAVKVENRIVSERSNNMEPFVSKVESEAAPLVPFNDAVKIENRFVSERSNNMEPFVSKVESDAVPLVSFNDAINQGFIPESDDGEYRNVPLTARDVIERPIDRQNILDIPAKDNDIDWGKELPIESNYVDRLRLSVNGLAKGNVRSEIPKEHLNPFFKPGEKYINFLKRSYFPKPEDPSDPDPDASVLPDDADILNKY